MLANPPRPIVPVLAPRRIACAWAVGLALAALPARAAAAPADPNAECQECHADPVKAKREKPRGGSVTTIVESAALARSEHRGMACLDCHVKAFRTYPHPEAPLPVCADCHVKDDPRPGKVAWAAIDAEFKKSVHVDKHAEFKCTQCHDAHSMQLDETRRRVFDHNKVCLRCHASNEEFGRFAKDKARPDLEAVHTWLPNRELHWATVRCLDCHSSYEPPVGSHLILPKKDALKKCESCHSANSVLRIKLYKHRRAEETERLGFVNTLIVNDAYVIGATRNRFVDLAGLGLLGGAIAGVLGHGLLRLLAARARGSKRDDHGEGS